MARILKKDAQKMLGNVPEENVFRCCDGHAMVNMSELNDALGNISDETFAFHANQAKNDFSNWVRDIIKDEKLARDLSKATDRLQAAKSVAARLSFLQKRLAQPV